MTRITIRPLRLTDADDIHELMHMPNVLWGTSRLPSTTAEEWRLISEQWIHDERMHVFVADIQNKVVGMVRVRVGQGRMKHVGDLSMAVHDKHQGQGIGKMLVLTAIDLADNWLNLVRLSLEVYVDNERAMRLYKNFDFEIEGRIRASSYRNGKYIDSYLMGRLRPQGQNGYAEIVTQLPVSSSTASTTPNNTSETSE
jgi:putative acetyltransferase